MVTIKEIRIKKGFTQQQLADETGITLRTIQRIENGEVKPSLHSLSTLGKVLETDLSDFFQKPEAKAYEFNFTVKITDMNQFLTDLKTLVKKSLENNCSDHYSYLDCLQLHRYQSGYHGWMEWEVEQIVLKSKLKRLNRSLIFIWFSY